MKGQWNGGKGDARRPGDDDKFREQYDRIFGKKKKTRSCFDCDEIIPWNDLYCEKCKKKNEE